jgi:hypothetical protein
MQSPKRVSKKLSATKVLFMPREMTGKAGSARRQWSVSRPLSVGRSPDNAPAKSIRSIAAHGATAAHLQDALCVRCRYACTVAMPALFRASKVDPSNDNVTKPILSRSWEVGRPTSMRAELSVDRAAYIRTRAGRAVNKRAVGDAHPALHVSLSTLIMLPALVTSSPLRLFRPPRSVSRHNGVRGISLTRIRRGQVEQALLQRNCASRVFSVSLFVFHAWRRVVFGEWRGWSGVTRTRGSSVARAFFHAWKNGRLGGLICRCRRGV